MANSHISTTTRKRSMVCPPAYSQCDDINRNAVAKASPTIMSRPSLPIKTNTLVGTRCPPILSIAHLGYGHEVSNSVSAVFRLMLFLLPARAVFGRHGPHGGAVG